MQVRSSKACLHGVKSILLFLCCAAFLASCRRSDSTANRSAPTANAGRALATKWCGTCHLPPEPGDLPRNHWPTVCKWMGNYLGYKSDDPELRNVICQSLVASQPSISSAELQAIEDYYISNAPDHIEPSFKPDQPPPLSTLFTCERWPGYDSPRTISLVKIDPDRRRLYLGSAEDSQLALFGADASRIAQVNCNHNQAIRVRPNTLGFDLVLIGSLGKDTGEGTVHKVTGTGTIAGPLRSQRVVEGFFRTSGADWGDLDGDGREEVVLAGFGDYTTGALAWFSPQPGGAAERHDLRLGSGTLDVVVDDVDHDGDQDILAIIAQGNQEVWWFENEGQATFHPRLLWKERPAMGYNGFQWIDFNGDGKKDIIAVAGNNMEMIDPPIKSLHGIYVYLQTDHMQFKQPQFLRFDGATKAIAADFDSDGDLDIAAISAYPDWRAKRIVTFVLFTNEGNGQFTPTTIPEGFSGQFITMDAGDLDGDGDLDIVLGGFALPPQLREPLLPKATERLSSIPPVVVLRNQSRPSGRTTP